MYMSTGYNKGIYGTTSVQCAAACKWLQPGSGLVDAFLTALVDAAQRRAYPSRIVISRTTAHTGRCASVYESKQINVAKNEAVQ